MPEDMHAQPKRYGGKMCWERKLWEWMDISAGEYCKVTHHLYYPLRVFSLLDEGTEETDSYQVAMPKNPLESIGLLDAL